MIFRIIIKNVGGIFLVNVIEFHAQTSRGNLPHPRLIAEPALALKRRKKKNRRSRRENTTVPPARQRKSEPPDSNKQHRENRNRPRLGESRNQRSDPFPQRKRRAHRKPFSFRHPRQYRAAERFTKTFTAAGTATVKTAQTAAARFFISRPCRR